MRELRTSGSVGAGGGQPPSATRPRTEERPWAAGGWYAGLPARFPPTSDADGDVRVPRDVRGPRAVGTRASRPAMGFAPTPDADEDVGAPRVSESACGFQDGTR